MYSDRFIGFPRAGILGNANLSRRRAAHVQISRNARNGPRRLFGVRGWPFFKKKSAGVYYAPLNSPEAVIKLAEYFKTFHALYFKLIHNCLRQSPTMQYSRVVFLKYFSIFLKPFRKSFKPRNRYCGGGNLDRCYLRPPPLLSNIGKRG